MALHRRLNKHSGAFLVIPPSNQERVVLLTVDTDKKVEVIIDAPNEIRFRHSEKVARVPIVGTIGSNRAAVSPVVLDGKIDTNVAGGEG